LGRGRCVHVFILSFLPRHESDSIRLESREEAKEIQSAYESLGYVLTEVPPLSILERADWIRGELVKRGNISL
jgi:predicted ATPase